MSHASGDAGDSSSTIHAWNRTPGKPNLSVISGNVGVPWGGSSNYLDIDTFSGDTNPLEDVWSNQPESNSSRKIDNPSSQWPTPAEIAGGASASSLSDFAMHNTWNPPSSGATIALRSGLGNSDDKSEQVGTAPRAITGQQSSGSGLNISSVDDGLGFAASASSRIQRPHLPSIGSKPRGANSFSSWGSQADGDFAGFSSQPLTEKNASAGRHHENRTLSGEGSNLNATACSSISDSGNHTDGHCENDAIVNALVNTRECWGQRPVDQSTPWDVSQLPMEESATGTATPYNQPGQSTTSLLGDAVAIALQQQQQQRRIKGGLAAKQAASNNSFESNVWPSEPPTGTGIWEMHYEHLGERTARWKQTPPTATTTSSPGISRLSQPGGITSAIGLSPVIGSASTGSDSIPAVFGNMPPSGVLPPQVACGDMLRRGVGPVGSGFFPQQPQRFVSQGAPPPQSFPMMGGGGGNVRNGPNGMLGMPGSFRQLQPSGGQSVWPFGAESPGQLDDGPKGFVHNAGSWPDNISHGRAIGKQQQKVNHNQTSGEGNGLNNRWQSPIGESPSGWAPDPRKLTGSGGSGWNPMGPPSSQNHPPSFMMPPYQVDSSLPPPRFHPPPLGRQQLPQRGVGPHALIRTNVARHLLNLSYTEEAQTLLTDPGVDMERFLCDLRDRTGNINLNQLISSVSTALAGSMSPSEPPLLPSSGAFDSVSGMYDTQSRDPNQHFLRPNHFGPPSTSFGGGGKFNRHNPTPNHPEFINQLQQRENQLIFAIMQLHVKHRELGAKQAQLRKMNVSPAPNPVLQELQLQRAQVVQQVEALDTQLNQVRRQTLTLSQLTAGGGGPQQNHSPMGSGMPNSSSPFGDLDVGMSMMNQRSGGGPPPHIHRGISPSHFTTQQNNNNSGRGGVIMNSDLSMRMSEMKLGQQMDLRRQMAWEGGGSGSMMWGSAGPNSAPGAGRMTNSNNNLSSDLPNPITNNFDSSITEARVPSTNPLGGDRRWAPSDTCSSTNENSAFAWSSSLSSVVNSNPSDSTSCCWLQISDLAPHISLSSLRTAISCALKQTGGDFEMHVNMTARYILLEFTGPTEANILANLVANIAISHGIKPGSTEIISVSEAMAKLQEIKNPCTQVDGGQSTGATL